MADISADALKKEVKGKFNSVVIYMLCSYSSISDTDVVCRLIVAVSQ